MFDFVLFKKRIIRRHSIVFLLLAAVMAGYGALPAVISLNDAAFSGTQSVSEQTIAPEISKDGAEQTRTERFIRKEKKIPNKYIVVLEDAAAGPRGENSKAETFANDLAAEFSGRVDRVYKHAINGFAVEMSDERAEAMSRDPRVKYVEQDSEISASSTQPNAPWGLDRVDQHGLPLDTVYNYTLTGAGVRAYVIDSGIRTTHTDFGGRATVGFDAFGQNGQDCMGHGTHVAGILGGATWGVAKNVSLVGVRVFNCFGEGSTSGVIAGVDWVTANAIEPAVANMSLGDQPSMVLDLAVNNSINSGIAYVVAAGNNAQDACNVSPARLGPAITVGATTTADQRWFSSNFGICVDLFAPGVGITSAWYTSDTATQINDGTSMAAPHVAGAAAMYLQANAGATPRQVRAFLGSEATKSIITSASTTNNHLLFTSWGATPLLATNVPPTAAFTYNCVGQTCTFDGTGSSDGDGTVAAYFWNFGDGQSGSAATAEHTFDLIGNHTVSLTVSDNAGEASIADSKNITIFNTPAGNNVRVNQQFGFSYVSFSQVTNAGNTRFDPVSNVPPYGNTLCGNCTTYSVSTSAAWISPVTVSIDVPAGTTDQTFNTMSMLLYPLPNFDVPPVNITTGRVSNPDGTREIIGQTNQLGTFALATQVVQQPNTAPSLSNLSAPQVNENGTATLSGNISDPDAGNTFTLTVNWGDGSAPEAFNYAAGTTSFSQTHKYLDNAAGGSYTINMTLADSAGGSTNSAIFVSVNNVAPSLTNIAANPSTIFAGSSTTVSGNISDPGTLDSFEISIDWRDGSASTILNLPAGSTTFSAQHQYTSVGNYGLIIVVRDKDFAATPYNPAVSVTVNNTPPPDISAVQATSPISENGTATLSGNVGSQVPNSTFSLAVNWGDGSQTQTFNYQAGTTSFVETHKYLDNPPGGSYTINATLTDSSGGIDTASASVTVNNVAPALSNIQVSPSTIVPGGLANLVGNISDPGSLDTQVVTVVWGDGSQSTASNLNAGATSFNASHVYSQTGTFNISVTGVDKDGGQSSAGTTITVVPPPPTPTPTPKPPFVSGMPFTELTLDGSAFAGLTPGPDGRLYGVTYDGPVSDNDLNDPKLDEGTLYSVDKDMTNMVVHHKFLTATDGRTPYNELTFNPTNGKFYGATSAGGQTGPGTVFSYDPATDEFKATPWSFTGVVWGSLVVSNGYLFGTVQSYPSECVFRLSPDLTSTMFLQCVDWGSSLQGLTLGDDGWLYGNALYSGINCDPTAPSRGCGEIFKVKPLLPGDPFDPQFQTIFQFEFYGGRDYPCPPADKFCVKFPHTQNYPVQQLEYGSDGYLYGATFYSVFRLDPHAGNVRDSFKTLWADGGGIQATVMEGVDGRLYFTDYGGGNEGVGRILSMYKNGGGVFELRNFTLLSGSTAYGPYGRLYQDAATKKIYGTTEYTDKAAPYPGTAFAIEVPPAEYLLAGSPDGTAPIVVDDALDIYVNGEMMYTDGMAGSGERGPIEIPQGYLKPGDVIRLVARDTYGICQSLSAVYLIDKFGTSTPLVEPGFSNGCSFPPGENGIFYQVDKTVPGNVNSAPVISNLSLSGSVTENGTASLSFLATDVNSGDTLTITVNWGDGTPNEVYNTPAASNIPINLVHQYLDDNPTATSSDPHLVSVTLSDGKAVDSKSQSITVNNSAPSIGSLSATPNSITVGGSTTLSGAFGDAGSLDAFTVQINWGDGTANTTLNLPAGSSSFSASHQYTTSGTKSASVTLTDDDGGTATANTSVVVNPAPTPPNAPSGLIARAASGTQIDLTWVDNSGNETSFEIEQCSGKGKCTTFVRIATLAANTVSYQNAGLSMSTDYSYRVRAVNATGNSAYSNVAKARTSRK